MHQKSDNNREHAHFTRALLKWAENSPERDMPWKGSNNPYYIWISEVILQQTRVEQGRAYFLKFIRAFPLLSNLAAAEEKEVLRMWQGLGYYSRARNMLKTAKQIVDEYDGEFPSEYEELLKLKGVGPYTAAAIASFAFGEPHAVVDGNVVRVLARYFAISTPYDTTKGKKLFQALATDLLPVGLSAKYNQAIMDFGATVCKPKRANCDICTMAKDCLAFRQNKTDLYPYKSKKLVKKTRFFVYFVVKFQGQFVLEKRMGKDIWQGMYQFPLIEYSDGFCDKAEDYSTDIANALMTDAFDISPDFVVRKQQLTHQIINACFISITLHSLNQTDSDRYIIVPKEKMGNFAYPGVVYRHLQALFIL